MGNAIDLDSRALWLTLRDHGGRWSPRRLFEHWQPTFCQREIEARLSALHKGGFVARQEIQVRGHRAIAYAVTNLCRALPGSDLQSQGSSTCRST